MAQKKWKPTIHLPSYFCATPRRFAFADKSLTYVTVKVAMVKLPSEQPRRAVREGDGTWRPRNHHNWGASARRRGEVYREPTGLLHLEELARRSVEIMERHGQKSDHNFYKVMDLLRAQHNLSFIVLCERCRGQHEANELVAPER
ncbi:hypothetical protein PYW07_007097 [Mythimna separata]|uniref:Uncharacterized protein n=1 Tax=Mythimna separata TaxID=271217 RepID=A0AAD8DZQ2_MYTSE|nr:hypothetical protein PYW07_007097 [Mythimna separata]